MRESEGSDEGAAIDVHLEGAIEPGTRIAGKYLVHRLLGLGGTSAVYEAEHLALGRRVAIKVLDARYGRRADVLARVLREARAAGSVRHANIADVYDVGSLEGERPYLVMEFLDGDSLDAWLQRGLLPIASVLEIGRQVLAGLAALHKTGVIHRDVKPHNIVLVPGTMGGLVVKLVDFGISKPVAQTAASPSITLEGQLIGTPHYMAPEQLRAEEIDARADVYAVGVLMYEAITRELPFDRPSLPELSAAVLRDSFPKPRVLRPDCPEALEGIVLRAMSRDREARFPDARSMADALTEAFGAPTGPLKIVFSSHAPKNGGPRTPSHMATLAPPGAEFARLRSTFPPARMSSPLRKVAAGGALGALLLGGVGLAVALPGWGGSELASTSAMPATAAAGAPPTRAASVPTPSALMAAPRGAGAAVLAAAASTHIEGEGAADDAPRVDVRRARGSRGRATAAGGATSAPAGGASTGGGALVVAAAAPSAASDPPPVDVDALVSEALGAYMRGQFPQARALYHRATVTAPRNVAAWRGLGLVAARLGQRRDATRAFERYLTLAPTAPDAARIRGQLEQLGSATPP